MKLGISKIHIFLIILFLANTTFLFGADKIVSVPLVNLEELLPTFEEDKDVLENKDKQITNREMIAYLKTNVSKEAFTQNREQDPMLSGDPDQVLMSYR